MGLAAFQRQRREQAELKAKQEQEVKPLEEEKEAAEGENESLDVDSLDIEQVKQKLEELEVKFAHNTSEKKLRDKLKDAIS